VRSCFSVIQGRSARIVVLQGQLTISPAFQRRELIGQMFPVPRDDLIVWISQRRSAVPFGVHMLSLTLPALKRP